MITKTLPEDYTGQLEIGFTVSKIRKTTQTEAFSKIRLNTEESKKNEPYHEFSRDELSKVSPTLARNSLPMEQRLRSAEQILKNRQGMDGKDILMILQFQRKNLSRTKINSGMCELIAKSETLFLTALQGLDSQERSIVREAILLIQEVIQRVDDSINVELVDKYGLIEYLEEFLIDQSNPMAYDALWTINNLYTGLIQQKRFPKSPIIQKFIIRQISKDKGGSKLLELVYWHFLILSSYHKLEQEPAFSVISDMVQAMKKNLPWLIQSEFIFDLVKCLENISQQLCEKVTSLVLTRQFVQFMIQGLNLRGTKIQILTLQVVSNLLCHPQIEKTKLLSYHQAILPSLSSLLEHRFSSEGMKVVLIALTNYININSQHLDRFMESPACEQSLNQLLDSYNPTQLGALHLLQSVVQNAAPRKLVDLVEQYDELIQTLFNILERKPRDKSKTSAIILLIGNLLSKTEEVYRKQNSVNRITQELCDLGMTGVLMNLVNRKCLADKINSKAIELLDLFFDPVDEEFEETKVEKIDL